MGPWGKTAFPPKGARFLLTAAVWTHVTKCFRRCKPAVRAERGTGQIRGRPRQRVKEGLLGTVTFDKDPDEVLRGVDIQTFRGRVGGEEQSGVMVQVPRKRALCKLRCRG